MIYKLFNILFKDKSFIILRIISLILDFNTFIVRLEFVNYLKKYCKVTKYPIINLLAVKIIITQIISMVITKVKLVIIIKIIGLANTVVIIQFIIQILCFII
jgi:uncharacterized membrane protein